MLLNMSLLYCQSNVTAEKNKAMVKDINSGQPQNRQETSTIAARGVSEVSTGTLTAWAT